MPTAAGNPPLPAGVHRVVDPMVNMYLVEDGDALTVVDAGFPGLYPRLLESLAAAGRSLADVRAVLLTHGHPDHTGLAERIRSEANAAIWVHEADAPLVADPRHLRRHWRAERSLLPYVLRHPAALSVPVHLARMRGFRPPPVQSWSTFTDGQSLDAPGSPRVVWTPGHTAGSSSLLFAEHGILFTGDALVTRDDMTGGDGPRIVARAFTQDSHAALASVRTLAAVEAAIVLPGHGEPFGAGVATACEQALATGVT